MNVLPACVYVHHKRAVPVEARKGLWVPWNWNYRQLWAPCGCWKPNPDPLQEQPVFFTSEHLSSTPSCSFGDRVLLYSLGIPWSCGQSSWLSTHYYFHHTDEKNKALKYYPMILRLYSFSSRSFPYFTALPWRVSHLIYRAKE